MGRVQIDCSSLHPSAVIGEDAPVSLPSRQYAAERSALNFIERFVDDNGALSEHSRDYLKECIFEDLENSTRPWSRVENISCVYENMFQEIEIYSKCGALSIRSIVSADRDKFMNWISPAFPEGSDELNFVAAFVYSATSQARNPWTNQYKDFDQIAVKTFSQEDSAPPKTYLCFEREVPEKLYTSRLLFPIGYQGHILPIEQAEQKLLCDDISKFMIHYRRPREIPTLQQHFRRLLDFYDHVELDYSSKSTQRKGFATIDGGALFENE